MKGNPDMDTHASGGIDELLNSFIDGELTARQQTEVERLIAHDAKIAQRLRQLQQCKMLVGSLPHAEAPAEVLEDIKAALAMRTLPDEHLPTFDERAGKRQLLVRRLLSAAAMFGLVAVLAAVIYTIVATRTVPEGPVAVDDRQPLEKIEVIEPGPSVAAATRFSGRLELKTSALTAVDAFINRAIEDSGLSDSTGPARRQDKRIYPLSCSRQDLNLLLAVLGNIWSELDSATLFVDTEVFGRQVAVDAVTPEQIVEIVNQNNSERTIEVAKDFAALNNMAEHVPGRDIIAAIEDGSRSLITIPKPVLTGKQGTIRKPVGQAEDKETVHLTIIVNW